MKNILNRLLLLSLTTMLLVACEKEETKIYYESSSSVVMTASSTSLKLDFVNAQKEIVKLAWNNPEYKFTTGINSQDVTYKVEIDTTNANFTNPNRKEFNISKDLELSLTDSALNDVLLNQLNLVKGIPHNIEMRVTATLIGGALPVVSNVIKFTGVVPYAIPPKVAIPSSGKLFLVGSATPGDWNNPVPVPSQQFTKIDDTHYEITIQLKGGGSYLMLPVNGDWGDKYGWAGSNNANNPNGDDLKRGGGDILAPAADGSYKIAVDFQRGKFTVTK